MSELFDRSLNTEIFFCENHLLNLRRAFDWVIAGKHIAKTLKYSPFDGILVYSRDLEQRLLSAGRFDFKNSTRTDSDTLNTFSISENCHKALKQVPNSILFIYCEPSETLIAIDYDKIETGSSKIKDNVGLYGLRDAVISIAEYPIT